MAGQKWSDAQKAKFKATMAAKKAERDAGGGAAPKALRKGSPHAGGKPGPQTGPLGAYTPSKRSRSLERRLVEVLEEITVVSLAELRRDRRLRARLVDAVETLLHAIS